MAIRFNGSTDVLTRTTSLPTVSAFTMMAWVQIVTDRNDYSCFWSLSDDTDLFYFLSTDENGTTLLIYTDGTLTGSALTVGTWYHLAMTGSGTGAGQVLAYLNGVVNITGNGAAGTPTNMKLGNNVNVEWLNGRMAAIKIYNAALTANEIKNEMWSYLPMRAANLNGWYPFLTATDLAQYGPAWTAGGTVTTEAGPALPWARGRPRPWRVAPVGGGTSILRQIMLHHGG